MREYMEKDIRQSLQEHIFRLENRRRELMRPEYLRLGLTIGQGQPRILMYLLTEDGCSQREIAENCRARWTGWRKKGFWSGVSIHSRVGSARSF